MDTSSEFFLVTCPGIPDSMWIAVSKTMDITLKHIWPLLSAFVVIKMLSDAFKEVGRDRFSLSTHLRTLFQSFLIKGIRKNRP